MAEQRLQNLYPTDQWWLKLLRDGASYIEIFEVDGQSSAWGKLVDCFNHKLPALDGNDDAVGIGGPDKRFGVLVGLGDEALDCCLEVDDRVEHAPL